MRIVCLPWYELAETRTAQDRLWSLVRQRLGSLGVRDLPKHLRRRPIIPSVLADQRFLLGQCCGYDVIYGLADLVQPLATPCYAALGCEGGNYRSFVLVRDSSDAKTLVDLRGCVINSFNSHSGTNAL